jgi:8-oxo-dGTP diphosphatase
MTDVKRYCIGFLFHNSNQVLLVNKTHPDWQVGLWNGVGGVIEEGEAPRDAMPREFMEETGIKMSADDWTHFCTEYGPGYELYCYKALYAGGARPLTPSYNDEGEPLSWLSCSFTQRSGIVVGNLHWLIPLALDWRELSLVVEFYWNRGIKEKPTW